ncbi:MAG: esterase-like activity of phytase family protein [Paracoccaceae bacterium]
MRRRFTVALITAVALAAALGSFAQSTDGVTLIGSYRWKSDLPGFGGFSGLKVTADGQGFTIVSDGGIVGTGRFERSETSGDITGILGYVSGPLKTSKGEPTHGFTDDAEGLAIRPDGSLLVSFEGFHRIMVYKTVDAKAVWHKHNDAFKNLQNNSGLEALALDANGVLYTLPERSGMLTRPFPVYRFKDNEWDQPFGIPRRPPFLPVGADFGPDGKFYLLERHFSGIFGFQTRVRRFEFSDTRVTGEETLLETSPGVHDNLEGISVWRDAEGELRITMISDDNFRAFQRTEFVEYRVTE